MKTFEINISGSGTQNQLAIRLLEIGRMLQLQDDMESLCKSPLEDGCLITEISEE